MLERTKLSTVQYAKSQMKWIRKQLLPAIKEARDQGDQVWVYVVPGGEAGQVIANRISQCKLFTWSPSQFEGSD